MADSVDGTIHGGERTFINSVVKDFTISFSPHSDGSFVQLSADINGDVVDVHGCVAAGVLDSDDTSAHCEHHWHFRRAEP